MTPRHYTVEQVSAGAKAAIAVPSGGGVGNAGIVGLDGGRSLVVDAGFMPAAGAELRDTARQLAGPVERLVITHGDFDHYGGAAAFADLPIVATELTRSAIEENGPGRIEELRSGFDKYVRELHEKGAPEWEQEQARVIGADLPSLELAVPSETFPGELDLGAVRLVDYGPNHTDSDTAAWFVPERVLFTGDLVGVESHLNLMRGDPQNWLRTLDRLDALEPQQVVPGHGPAAGPEAIATARLYIETLLRLAAEPGDHETPEEYREWTFAEGFQRNLASLREH